MGRSLPLRRAFGSVEDRATTGSDVTMSGQRHLLRRARTAAGLPGRVVTVEDRQSALEREVGDNIAAMRHELAEIRLLLSERLAADAEATELLGRLLQASEARLDAVEEQLRASLP
jgi:hypothetical protein